MKSDREFAARYDYPSHSLGPDSLPYIHPSEELGRKRNVGVRKINKYFLFLSDLQSTDVTS